MSGKNLGVRSENKNSVRLSELNSTCPLEQLIEKKNRKFQVFFILFGH